MQQAETFNELYEQVALRKVPFLLVFFSIMIVSYGVLFAVDFIPEPLPEEPDRPQASVINEVRGVNRPNGGLVPADATEDNEADTGGMRVIIPDEGEDGPVSSATALPVSITFDSLDNRTVNVLNPTSNSIAVLDEALLSGVVRHPDSANFAEPGNMFILGHSSYLPTVFNRNFQAFNGIQGLTWGDTIRVNSSNTEYVYRVDRVYKAKASEVTVPVTSGEAKLTLATCNSFASKDDRYIVEATLVNTNIL